MAEEAGVARGQGRVDQLVDDWQYVGRHMTEISKAMTKRDEKYCTGSVVQRSYNSPWLDELVRKHGRIFMGS
jgi:hypothetical protein